MAKGIVYKGDVFLRRYVSGVLRSNIIGPVGGTKLMLKAGSNINQRFGKGRDNNGLLTGSTGTSAPTEVSLGFNEVDTELFAMLFMGTAAALSESGGTVSGESITLVKDVWVKTVHRNISASAITSLNLGVDFIQHPRMGAIKALTVGAVGAQSLDYAYGEITGTRISGGVASKIDVEIVFDGVNLEDESDAWMRIPKITLTPNSDIDLLAGDYVDAEMNGKAIKLPNETGDIVFDDSVVY